MRRKFREWIFKKLYFRALEVQHEAFVKDDYEKVNECIRLQNQMNKLKDDLLGVRHEV